MVFKKKKKKKSLTYYLSPRKYMVHERLLNKGGTLEIMIYRGPCEIKCLHSLHLNLGVNLPYSFNLAHL